VRPTILHIGGTLYWTIRTYNPDTSVLKDADSTPTVAVRKNGSSTGDSVTITKRSATTGIYDCSYTPSGPVEGDEFTFEESATVTGTTTAQATYSFAWSLTVTAIERGTDSAALASGVTVTFIANNAITAASIAADAGTEIGAAVLTALGTGTWATAIPWNVAWDEEVQSECTDALNDYDPPTKAELDAGLDALPTAAEIRTEIDSNSTKLVSILDEVNFCLTILAGTISDAQTAAESYAITRNGSTYTIDFTGLDNTGNRTGATLTKT
jgi:hypothetical protein